MGNQTDTGYEVGQGRIPCWLSEDQIDLLVDAARIGRRDTFDAMAQQWADIQFRLSAAKQKFQTLY